VLVVGIVLLVVAYRVPRLEPAVRQLAQVFGWVCALIGGLLVIAALLGVTT
jgi:hypothetical protein